MIQKAVLKALHKDGINKPIRCDTLCHSRFTQLLASGSNNRMALELLGLRDLKTVMIYTHVFHREVAGDRSPLNLM